MRTTGKASIGIAGLTLGVLLTLGMAQPGSDERDANQTEGGSSAQTRAAEQPTGSNRERPRRGGSSLEDPEAIKDRLRASIERGDQMLARQREALERLEAGESPAEVMRSLRVRLWDRRDRPEHNPALQDPDGERREPGRSEMPRPSHEAGKPDGFVPDFAEPIPMPELRAFLTEHFPTVDEQLGKLERLNPEAGDRLFARLAPRLSDVALDMRRDERLGTLRVEEMRASLAVIDATQAYASVRDDTGSSADAEAALRRAIGERFDARVALRQYEVERLVARIGELNDEILAEIGSREDEIERGFREITRRLRTRGGRDRSRP